MVTVEKLTKKLHTHLVATDKNLPQKLQQHLGGSMSDLISRAERFARVRHEAQFRKGKAKEPYTNHLVEVAALVERWSGSESAIAAAWLHDTVEDCPLTSVAEPESLFGKDAA